MELSLYFRIIVAALLGGLVGLEREMHGSDAGFRTHILVSTGSALFMIISLLLPATGGAVAADSSRIAAGVVTGIGFLGAGAVIRNECSVQGLTTAASIWIVAAIGLASGAGLYVVALLTSVIAFIVLVSSRWPKSVKRRIHSKKKEKYKS
jgi:putative Mg2+ transporter-C (MgtC) family protein